MPATRKRAFGYSAIAVVAAAMALAVLLAVARRSSPPRPAAAPAEVPSEPVAPAVPVVTASRAREPEPTAIPAFVEVRDAATDAPLTGAVIELLDTKGQTIGTQATDTLGRVAFPGSVPPPGGVLCRHPGYRVAGRCELLADHALRLQPARSLLVELARVPEWLDAWTLDVELRYSHRIAAAQAIGNHLAHTRIGDYAKRASIAAHRASLAVEIETASEVAILGRPPDGSPGEELACAVVRTAATRVVVDLGGLRKRGKVWTLRGTVELPAGHALRGIRTRPMKKSLAPSDATAGVIESPTTFASPLLEEGDYWIDLDVASGSGEPWLVALGPEHVASDVARRWTIDLQPQVRVTVLGRDEVTAGALRVNAGHRPEYAVRRIAKDRLELADLAPGGYEVVWPQPAKYLEGEFFVVEAGGAPIEVVLDARPRHLVEMKIDAGGRPEEAAKEDGVLQVRDDETGRWFDPLHARIARVEKLRRLWLPAGRYVIQVRYPEKTLEASVLVPAESGSEIRIDLR